MQVCVKIDTVVTDMVFPDFCSSASGEHASIPSPRKVSMSCDIQRVYRVTQQISLELGHAEYITVLPNLNSVAGDVFHSGYYPCMSECGLGTPVGLGFSDDLAHADRSRFSMARMRYDRRIHNKNTKYKYIYEK